MSSLYHSVSIKASSLPCVELEGNLFLAPIAGYSDRAFRTLCVEQGASMCTTEMVSSEALTRGSAKTSSLMCRSPEEKVYAVQLFGGEPGVMAEAAKIVLEKTTCEVIDINGGCPVPKIVKCGAGSVLTKDPERTYSIVCAMKKAIKEYVSCHPERAMVPLTLKIRSGWDSSSLTYRETSEAAIEAGIDAMTLHARTKAQGYEGKANWDIQRQWVEFVGGRVPVFGSGDAHSPETARLMLEETGVDGVMFARGAMGDPFIFKRTIEYLTTGEYRKESFIDRIRAGFRELEMNVEDKGETVACSQMRKKFCAYASGVEGASALRRLIVSASSVKEYRDIFSHYNI